MKLRHLFIISTALIILIAASKPLFADMDEFTGEEWFSMPASHRTSAVSTAKYRLEDKGVHLSKSLDEYVNDVNDVFKKNSDTSAKSVTKIFHALVYSNEPGAKKVMDELIKKKQIDKIEKL